MEKWMIRNIKADTRELQKELKISNITAKLLINRGIKSVNEAKSFLYPNVIDMFNPRMMKDVEKGAAIVKKSISEKNKIMVVGDYDVDGVISTYILYDALKKCGADICYEIPHRINDGYGINKTIIDRAIEKKVETIITCDNGIAALEAITYAKENGIKIVVTDHHEIPPAEFGEIPADAIINPKQRNCGYPFKKLCGAGVALKFIQVLFEEMGVDPSKVDGYIQFAAIATVCDVVELTGENRIIVKYGIDKIVSTENEGLKQLMKINGLEGKKLTTYSLGFVIGPCINATGRLDWANKGVELFLTEDKTVAAKLAEELFHLNEERKKMTIDGTDEVIKQIEDLKMIENTILVVHNSAIHESVAGIIAGRIREKYSRPAIMLTSSKCGAKGSGRSIEGYDLFQELLKCRDLLDNFGGHPMAAGLSISESKIEELRNRLNRNSTLTVENLIPRVSIDMQLPMDMINMELASELELLEPYGTGNPKPVFAEKNVKIHNAKIIGENKNAVRLLVNTKNGKLLNGIYFGNIDDFKNNVSSKYGVDKARMLDFEGLRDINLDIAFNIDVNEYKGNSNVQLKVTNIR